MEYVVTKCKETSAQLASSFVHGFPLTIQNFATLKFRNSETEDAYACQNSDELKHSIRIVAAGLVFFSTYCAGASLYHLSSSLSKQQHTVYEMLLIVWVSTFCIAFCAFITASPAAVVSFHLASEKFAFLLVHLAFLIGILSDRCYATRIIGLDCREIWGPDTDISDTRILLSLDVIMAVTHVMLPIRWHILVFIQVSGFFAYIIAAFGIGSQSDAVGANITAFLALVVLASIRQRSLEMNQRRNFQSITCEKNKTAQAEYSFSPATDQKPTDSNADPAKKGARLGSSSFDTTPSSMIFGDEQISLSDVEVIGAAEQWLVDEKHIEVAGACSLGVGAFSAVRSALYHGTLVAVKQCQPKANTEANMLLLCNELRILRRMRHPSIVAFYGAIVHFQAFSISLVMEHVSGQSLQELIVANHRVDFTLPVKEKMRILCAICGALFYLHSRHPGVVHGDLKPSNVLVERVMNRTGGWDCSTKLLDFGLSRLITKRARPLGGTLQWVGPEVIQQDGVLTALPKASDVYSFGRIAFAFLTGILDTRNERAILRSLRRGDVAPLFWPIEALQNKLISQCVSVVDSCCLETASRRPNVEEVHQVFMTLSREDIGELSVNGKQASTLTL
eukprot:TRINITY_DN13218_c1_g1_i1.p1 TRINITY_DN13218_c1_g1~~TRINITY_DN13218_c1_g1_i1.p1  ORF type:complete len:620 (+),score=44.95 TRINITY_DN13218_c1_g1_i1:122-1981(+)